MKKEKGNRLRNIFILMGVLVVIVLIAILTKIDLIVNRFFLSIQSPVGMQINGVISFLASEPLVIVVSLIILLVLYKKRDAKDTIFYVSNIIGGVILTFVIKNIVRRFRPVNNIETDFSFPSGHALESAALYWSLSVLLWNKNRKLAWVCFVIPFLVSFSRLYLGVHWLTDVLAGLAIGGMMILISEKMVLEK